MGVEPLAKVTEWRRLAALGLLALALAGCDKCGNRVHFVAPSIQHSCGDGAEPR